MNIYGDFAFAFRVCDKSSVMSCASVVFARRGERRRGIGAMGDAIWVWEGILILVVVARLSGCSLNGF
jgi:hypothetical protein